MDYGLRIYCKGNSNTGIVGPFLPAWNRWPRPLRSSSRSMRHSRPTPFPSRRASSLSYLRCCSLWCLCLCICTASQIRYRPRCNPTASPLTTTTNWLRPRLCSCFRSACSHILCRAAACSCLRFSFPCSCVPVLRSSRSSSSCTRCRCMS